MEYGKFRHIIGIVVWFNPTIKEKEALQLYNKDLETVIIVDNSAEDNSRLCEDIPNVRYLPCLDNKGIAAALNIGCQEALRLGADWVLTMDQDSRWDQFTLPEYICEALQYSAFDKVAIFSPFHDCDGHPERHRREGRFQHMRVIMCSGNLLRLVAWQDSGGFREDFFIDNVDDEISCHLRQLGWEVIRTNKIFLSHDLGNGVQYIGLTHHRYTPHPAWRYYYIGRNWLRMAKLYPEMASYYIRRVLKELKRLILYDWTDKRNRLKYYMRGIYDGLQTYPPKDLQLTLRDTYESWRPWLTETLRTFEKNGVVLHDARNQIRMIEAPDGTKIIIKRFRQPIGFKRILYSFFRLPKAERSYYNAIEMEQAELPTPRVIGYARNDGKLLGESFLITQQSPLTRDFYEFRYHDAAGYEDVIRAFAQLVADMHRKGFYHRDLSPGNILFDRQKDGSIAFDIIDVNRMRISHTISKKEACSNFCRLWGRMDFIEMLGHEYALARGWNEVEVTKMITRYWRHFWHIRTEQDIEMLFARDLKR